MLLSPRLEKQQPQVSMLAQDHVILFDDENSSKNPASGSTLRLIAVTSPQLETVRQRSMQFWCVRFLTLVFLVSLFQLGIVLLFPAIFQLFSKNFLLGNTTASSSLLLLASNNNRPTQLNDLYLAVKSTKRFHQSRLNLLLDTWIEQAKTQTIIFTDSEDESIRKRLLSEDGQEHFVVTDCAPQHSREALACKMAREFAGYYQKSEAPRWFCHFDDDTYTNVPRLVNLLSAYDHHLDWYLGRPSLNKPMRLPTKPKSPVEFNFATGGAGFCLSQNLMKKLRPHILNGEFEKISAEIRLPDDCTVGYIVEAVIGRRLTVIGDMHSHLEYLSQTVNDETLGQAITFSYSKMIDRRAETTIYDNVVGISTNKKFNAQQDPTRLLTSHCALFPSLRICQ